MLGLGSFNVRDVSGRLTAQIFTAGGGPAGFVDLTTAGNRQRVGRNFIGDRRACSDIGAVSHGDRRNERRIAAYKNALAKFRSIFLSAIVIAGNRSLADV